jgi:hypothetical protein
MRTETVWATAAQPLSEAQRKAQAAALADYKRMVRNRNARWSRINRKKG